MTYQRTKWTGPESMGQVLSLKAANVHDPQKGLEPIWQRLDELYGLPQLIELSLRRKLDNFPRLTNAAKDSKKLYELSDIVSEIEAIKEDPAYSSLLAYFDSSSGVSPIVSKLPYSLQERWTTNAYRYMEKNDVCYPPFSHFSQFLREQSKIRNNPSFVYSSPTQARSVAPSCTTPRNVRPITVRKTSVTPENVTSHKRDVRCPLHNTDHPLNECKTVGRGIGITKVGTCAVPTLLNQYIYSTNIHQYKALFT